VLVVPIVGGLELGAIPEAVTEITTFRIVSGVVGIACVLFFIGCLADAISSPAIRHRGLWLLGMLLFTLPLAASYYIVVMRPVLRRSSAAQPALQADAAAQRGLS